MLTAKDEEFFKRAFELAKLGEHRVRVGCLAVSKSTPLCGSFNKIRNITTKGVEYTAHTYHAEQNVLAMIPYRLVNSSTLYVCRIDGNNDLKPSKPCFRCRKKINKAGIKEIVYWNRKILKERIPI